MIVRPGGSGRVNMPLSQSFAPSTTRPTDSEQRASMWIDEAARESTELLNRRLKRTDL
jgi:hypothetical protein